MHWMRALLYRVLGWRAPVHPRGRARPQPDHGDADRQPRFPSGRQWPHAAGADSARGRSGVRGMQFMLAGVPGGRLHYHGPGRHGQAAPIVGTTDRSHGVNTLIRNGTVVTARETTAADVLIEGERIREVRPGIAAQSAEKVIDAPGLYVMPGGIDAHT